MAPPTSILRFRSLLNPFSSPLFNPFLHSPNPKPFPISTILTSLFSTQSNPINTKVNFSLPDSDSDSDSETPTTTSVSKGKTTQMPPPRPFDPFKKGELISKPEDPKNLQEVFHRMKTDGLIDNAVKMFDGLSKDGLTHEALELFRVIKDKGTMPDVVAHTAVIEAYADAGKGKEALTTYKKMLACGVAPNAYTYGVLIKGLSAEGGMVGEVRRYVVEMMEKGMRPNVGTCVAVFEGFVREGKAEDGRELLEVMRAKGFRVDERAVREAMKGKRGHVVRGVMDLLLGK